MAEKLCPSCHKPLKLREASYPMGSSFLKADRVHVDIYECPECHGIRLYAAESDMCAVCALNAAIDEATNK